VSIVPCLVSHVLLRHREALVQVNRLVQPGAASCQKVGWARKTAVHFLSLRLGNCKPLFTSFLHPVVSVQRKFGQTSV
jgi:hypothetical protein